jgi:hypothetical protein
MKRSVITEYDGDQKSLTVLYPMKLVHNYPSKTRCVLLHYGSSKHCTCHLNKFI